MTIYRIERSGTAIPFYANVCMIFGTVLFFIDKIFAR